MSDERGAEAPSGSSRACPGCGKPLLETDRFCPFCGRNVSGFAPPPMPPPNPYYQQHYQQYYPPSYQSESTVESLKRLGRGITSISLLPLLVLLAVNVIILLWSPAVVLPETADPSHGNTLFILLPISNPIVDLVDLTGPSFAAYHLFLVASITACFAWMVYRSLKPYREELQFKMPKEGHSPFYTIGTIFFAVMAFNAGYVILLGLFGVQMNTPDFGGQELWQLLDGLASASVWEELVSRVLLIGVPLLIIDTLMNSRKRTRNYLLGGGFDLGGKELVLLFASSGIFALGHIVYWDAWKILPSWVAGIAFGFLFLRIGLYASIMLHFTIDYLTIPLDMTTSVLVSLALGLCLLLWEVLGSIYFLSYLSKMARFLTGADLRPKPEPKPVPHIVPMGYGPYNPPPGPGGPAYGQSYPQRGYAPPPRGGGFFTCANCGNTEAVYRDGKLECTRCGNRQ